MAKRRCTTVRVDESPPNNRCTLKQNHAGQCKFDIPEPVNCNAMFCVLDTHEGDRHVDVTGYGWHEPTPDLPVIARVYHLDGEGAPRG